MQTSDILNELNSEELVEELVNIWNDDKCSFNSIKDILMYMDKHLRIPGVKKIPIYVRCLQLFREIILLQPRIRLQFQSKLLQNILEERNGYIIDRDLMKEAISMYLELGIDGVNVYEIEFEQEFLAQTKKFYAAESLQYLSGNSCSAYLKKTEKWIKVISYEGNNSVRFN